MDLAYRVIQGGYEIVYEPEIRVDHFPMPSVVSRVGGRAGSELYFHVRNRAYLAYRYLPWVYAMPYMGIWMLRYAFRSLRGDGVAEFMRGAAAIPSSLRGVRREVLSRRSLVYLAQHGGRLWY
jgi:hypothetical protein